MTSSEWNLDIVKNDVVYIASIINNQYILYNFLRKSLLFLITNIYNSKKELYDVCAI